MCLVTFAYQQLDELPLILAANRDEWRDRPTAHAHIWVDDSSIYGGQDLTSGGSWLAVSTHAPYRLACVTNVRNPESIAEHHSHTWLSRGLVISDFIRSEHSCEDFLTRLALDRYGACNLILYDGDALWYASNRAQDGQHQNIQRQLTPGVYGLSNAQLDTSWPKTIATRGALADQLLTIKTETVDKSINVLRDSLWDALSNPQIYPEEQLPSTGVPTEMESSLSAALIVGEGYGTRSQALVFMARSGVQFEERILDHHGEVMQSSRVGFGAL